MRRTIIVWQCLFVLILCLPGRVYSQGIILQSIGPVNRGMGGASTAAPIDAVGAMLWNPAAISGLAESELQFGAEGIAPTYWLDSSVGAASGASRAEPGILPAPSIGLVYHLGETPVTLGFSLQATGGSAVNHQENSNNPILSAPPGGFGRLYSNAQYLQATTAFSVMLTDRLSVAVAPHMTLTTVGIQPFGFEPPNADGLYAVAPGTRQHFGGGVSGGLFYKLNERVNLGLGIKSPTWFETMRFFSTDASGASRILRLNQTLPMIISTGLGFSPTENLLIAWDVRFMDYNNAELFGDPTGFDASGAITGLGWRSVFATAIGIQACVTDRLKMRLGYLWNQKTIEDIDTFFNIASPLFYSHTFSAGFSYDIQSNFRIDAGYSYVPGNSVTGPFHTPAGPVPGTSVSASVDYHLFGIGAAVKF